MHKPVSICGRSISHRAARMLVTIADQKDILHTSDPEHDWVLLTEEHIRALTERTNGSDLRSHRGIGELIARELEQFFSEFGILLRPAIANASKSKWQRTARWNQSQPTSPGWYWWCEQAGREPIIYQVTDPRRLPADGWWLGPLDPPRFDAYRANAFFRREVANSKQLQETAA